jgi:DNA-binding NarL/FixJ family response regulator
MSKNIFLYNNDTNPVSQLTSAKKLQGVEKCSYNEISYRENQILDLIAEGYTSKEIGKKLKLSSRTIEGYRSSLMTKFNLRTPAHLISFAICNVLFCDKDGEIF